MTTQIKTKEVMSEWIKDCQEPFENDQLDEDTFGDHALTSDKVTKAVAKWKKQKAALVAQKRRDDAINVAGIIVKGDVLKTLLSLRLVAMKGDDCDGCARFKASVDEVQEWGWKIPESVAKAKSSGEASIMLDTGNIKEALQKLSAWTQEESKIEEHQFSFMKTVITDTLTALEDQDADVDKCTEEFMAHLGGCQGALTPKIDVLMRPVFCLVDPGSFGLEELKKSKDQLANTKTDNELLRPLKVFSPGKKWKERADAYLESYDNYMKAAENNTKIYGCGWTEKAQTHTDTHTHIHTHTCTHAHN